MKPDEDTNLYHPEDSDSGSDSIKKSSVITWTASEYIEHQRGAGWYAALAVITIVLAAGAYLLIHDYFAAAIIIILGLILAFYAGHQPRQMDYELSGRGIKVGEKSYAYSLFKSFSIAHDGALSTITFYPTKRLGLPISIFFEAKNEGRITKLIGDHLALEERESDGFDRLTRRLKL